MNRHRAISSITLGALLAIVAGCGSGVTVQSARAPGADLSRLSTFYVQKLASDDNNVDQLIANRLRLYGMKGQTGLTESPPQPVDAIVTYQDRWAWDFTPYMLQLEVQIRDGETRMVLAKGHCLRPSLIRKSPEGMVEEVLNDIFQK